jgi:pentatricopeptide repeat protein
MQPVPLLIHNVPTPYRSGATQEKVSQKDSLTVSFPYSSYGKATAADIETKAKGFVISALKGERKGSAFPVISTDGSTSSKPGSVLRTQDSKIKDCALKNFRGKEGCFPPSHSQPAFTHSPFRKEDVEILIQSLLGKPRPTTQESKCTCATITQSRQMTFVEALQLLNGKLFSPDSYIYSALFKKIRSWQFIAFLFAHIPTPEKDNVIYSMYITACGRNGQFVEAKKAFNDAVGRRIADEYTYSAYIAACGKNNQFEEAKKAFDTAASQEIADAYTYNSYIDICGKNGQFAEAKKTFGAAVELGIADKYTYNSYIDGCKNNQFEEAKKAFKAAASQEIADAYTYNSYIDVCGKNGQFAEAKATFDAAVELGIADKCIYNGYIDGCGKNGQFAEAKKAFDAAASQEIADAHTYNSYINACGKNGQFAEAKATFDTAVKLGVADAYIYSSYIDACSKNGQFAEARKAFTTAVQQKIASAITYHIYIDLLVKMNDYEQACQIFDAGRLTWAKKTIGGRRAIDLHTFSHGSGFIAIQRFVQLYSNNLKSGI